jgi:hypothetical protein
MCKLSTSQFVQPQFTALRCKIQLADVGRYVCKKASFKVHLESESGRGRGHFSLRRKVRPLCIMTGRDDSHLTSQ